MVTSTAKENILRKIRKALSNPVPLPFPDAESSSKELFSASASDLAVSFAENFKKIQGNFAFCKDEKDLELQLSNLLLIKDWSAIYCKESSLIPILNKINMSTFQDLSTCHASVTSCEFLISRTGTIVMSSFQESGRTTSVYAPAHICIAYTSQLVWDISDALKHLTKKYDEKIPSLMTFASGPSRTADIEKTLVTGVHGPKEVYCFLIDSK